MAVRGATVRRGRVPPPPRGVPYLVPGEGRMIVPAEGGKARRYEGALAAGVGEAFSPARALRRAGVAAAQAGVRRADRAAAAAPAAVGNQVGASLSGRDTSAFGLAVWVLATLVMLALLENLLGGRGPAAVQTSLDWLGGGIRRLISPVDPLLPRGPATPAAASSSATPSGSPATTPAASGTAKKGAGILAVVGRIIGLPGQGTHSFTQAPNNWQSDNAIDVAVPKGTPVFAPAAGVVVNAGYEAGQGPGSTGRFAGERITLQLAGNELFYGHLSALTVKAGQRVQAGQLIGYSGEANGVQHLHFATQVGSPLDWLLGRSKGGTK